MSCKICKQECEGDFCERCLELLDMLHDDFNLAQLSKLFTYALGDKVVQEITDKTTTGIIEQQYGKVNMNVVH